MFCPFGVTGSPVAVSMWQISRCNVFATSAPPVTADDWKMMTAGIAAPAATVENTTSAASRTPLVPVSEVSAAEVATSVPPAATTSETNLCPATKV